MNSDFTGKESFLNQSQFVFTHRFAGEQLLKFTESIAMAVTVSKSSSRLLERLNSETFADGPWDAGVWALCLQV